MTSVYIPALVLAPILRYLLLLNPNTLFLDYDCEKEIIYVKQELPHQEIVFTESGGNSDSPHLPTQFYCGIMVYNITNESFIFLHEYPKNTPIDTPTPPEGNFSFSSLVFGHLKRTVKDIG